MPLTCRLIWTTNKRTSLGSKIIDKIPFENFPIILKETHAFYDIIHVQMEVYISVYKGENAKTILADALTSVLNTIYEKLKEYHGYHEVNVIRVKQPFGVTILCYSLVPKELKIKREEK